MQGCPFRVVRRGDGDAVGEEVGCEAEVVGLG